MNLINECFDEHGSALSKILQDAGFSIDQADNFLPEAALGIVESILKTSVFQTFSPLLSDYPCKSKITIDINTIAKKLDMSSGQVTSGLHAIAPILLQIYSQKRQDMESVVPPVSIYQYVCKSF